MLLEEMKIGQTYYSIGLSVYGEKTVEPCTLINILKKPKDGYNIVVQTNRRVRMYDLAADYFATKSECQLVIKQGK